MVSNLRLFLDDGFRHRRSFFCVRSARDGRFCPFTLFHVVYLKIRLGLIVRGEMEWPSFSELRHRNKFTVQSAKRKERERESQGGGEI